jgi:predicted dehydrogenase
MYIDGIIGSFPEHAQLVGICDISQIRMDWHNQRMQRLNSVPPVPTFLAAQFDEMIRQTKPNTVIVTSVDNTHHQYIIRAMELGCDVICEKPLTVDKRKASAIVRAVQRTGRSLRVTFNYRYVPYATKVRELMMQQVIGRPLSIDFSWLLDTHHGADYFRRWHRDKANSGGLLVHKASHHFDLVNWWLDAVPQTVFAMGGLKFYGQKNAHARGESYLYNRYTGCPEARDDPFALMLDQANGEGVYSRNTLKGLYYEAEKDSGYIRDQNVFGEGISSEDTMSVLVRYRSGIVMNYSLIAYAPWEGFRIAMTGEKGRIELFVKHGSHIIAGQGDQELAAEQQRGFEQSLWVMPMFGVPYEVPIPSAEGGHGGGDPILLQHLLLPTPPADPFGRAAGLQDGLNAVMVGISANRSMETGLPVDCSRLFDERLFDEKQAVDHFEKELTIRQAEELVADRVAVLGKEPV